MGREDESRCAHESATPKDGASQDTPPTTLLAVYDGSNSLEARFECAAGRMPLKMVQGGNAYYLAYDQVGSLRAVFNEDGDLVHEVQYDSFGNVVPGTLC